MASAVHEQRRRLFLAEVSRVVPGLYGWVATVLLPVLQPGVPLPARCSALLAAVALAGAFFLSASPRLSRWLGVYGFVLLCFLSWILLGARLRADQIDPVRGALGAFGFLLHALAWGAPAKEPDSPALDNLVPGQPLSPRNPPTRAGAVLLAVGIAVALTPMILAFRIERPSSALLAHAVALGCGVLVIAVTADVALRIGKPRATSAWRIRAARALWPMGALTLVLAVGLLWLAVR